MVVLETLVSQHLNPAQKWLSELVMMKGTSILLPHMVLSKSKETEI
jgi:hypothetical protein